MNVLSTLEFGSTTIRAEYMDVVSYNDFNDDPYELDVEVENKVVEYIEITAVPTVVDPPNDEVHIPIGGFTVQLTVTAYFSDGSVDVVTYDTDWTLANADDDNLAGALINYGGENGLFISGTESGEQIVRAEYTYGNTVTASVTVYVDPGALQRLILVDADGSSATTSFYVGQDNMYAALGQLVGSTTYYYIADRDVVFNSTNVLAGEMVEGNDYDGEDETLLALAPGTTTVIVNHLATAINDSAQVTITDAIPLGIICRPGWVQRTPTDTVNYVVQILMSDGEAPAILDGTTNAETLSFQSDNTPVADFLPGSPLGLATAGDYGVATVTASWINPADDEEFSDTCDIEVVEELIMPGNCGVAYYIDSVDQSLYGSTENAGDNANNYNEGEDVFYSFILSEPATIDLSVITPDETGWDIVTLVAQGCSDGVCPNPSEDVFPLVDGETGELICLPSDPMPYYLIVDGTTVDDWGAFEIDLDFEFGCVPSFEGSYEVDEPLD
jgi:hypothetical protein